MTYAETKAPELIEAEIAKMAGSHTPVPDLTFALGMIEVAFQTCLISHEQYRGYTARITQAADERQQELWRAA